MHEFRQEPNAWYSLARAISAPMALAFALALLVAAPVQALDFRPPQSAEPVWTVETPELSGARGETVTLKVKTAVPDGWVIYSANPPKAQFAPFTKFTAPEGAPVSVGSPVKHGEEPHVKHEELFGGDVEYFVKQAIFLVPLRIDPAAAPGKVEAKVLATGQICEEGVCVPFRDVPLAFTLVVSDAPPVAEATSPTEKTAAAAPPAAKTGTAMEKFEAKAEALESDSGLGAYLWLAVLGGLTALLTPCVFPMVPITVSFFTKRKQATRGRAVLEAGVYSLGIVLTFTLLGVLCALLLGATELNRFAANPWVNIAIAALFLLLALNLFGFYEIRLPTALLDRLNRKAGESEGLGSVVLMALVFSITSFTCTGPFIGGVLAAAATGEWIRPVLGAATFSAVLAVPFFLLALFPSWLKKLPKAGGWLNSVKVVMGFLEVAAALKFASNADLVKQWGLLKRETFLVLWILCAVAIALYLLGLFRFPHDSKVERRSALRYALVAVFLALAAWLGTGLAGHKLGELDAFMPPANYAGHGEEGWHPDFDGVLADAKATGKPIFLDITGITCLNCRQMEELVFVKPEIQKLLERYARGRLYVDKDETPEERARSERNRTLQSERFKTAALPLYVLMDSDGRVLHVTGYTPDAQEFAEFLRMGLNADSAQSPGTSTYKGG
ncbi:MAG: DUF255 domain-containing protein [Planctomycetes bacterium]|nr:DUF255 domain-containing protein [Planctomycetota bacterium]